MKSLKQVIIEQNLKLTKLQQFNIFFSDIEEYIDVPFMPNSSIFKNSMPKLIAKQEIYTFVDTESEEILSTSIHSTILQSDASILFSDDINSTSQTIMLSSEPILQSDDTFI